MSDLVRLVYASTATTDWATQGGGLDPSVGRILTESRRNNPKQLIGGVLYFGNGYFFQCVEGVRDDIDQLYKKLQDDPRHTDVQILQMKNVSQREFDGWAMKYVNREQAVTAVLKRHGKSAFNPYEFNDAIIDEMLRVLSSERDATGEQQGKPAQRGFWGKLKSALGLG